ncbi:MAG: hypothetical protein PHS79_05865 [Patescibacteria group bacterium]|nr:hypothetical protein [Patescibacteria group bacterium]
MKLQYLLMSLIALCSITIAVDANSQTWQCTYGRRSTSCAELKPSTTFLAKFRRAVMASKYLDADKACLKSTTTIAASKTCLTNLDNRLAAGDRESLRRIIAGRATTCLLGSRSCMAMNLQSFIAQLDEDARAEQEQAFNEVLDEARATDATYALCLERPDAQQVRCDANLIKRAGLDKRWPMIATEWRDHPSD